MPKSLATRAPMTSPSPLCTAHRPLLFVSACFIAIACGGGDTQTSDASPRRDAASNFDAPPTDALSSADIPAVESGLSEVELCALAQRTCGTFVYRTADAPERAVDCGSCSCEPTQDGPLQLPAHAGYLSYGFADSRTDAVVANVRIENDPGNDVGLYYAPFNGSIDGTVFYAGLQTNLSDPSVGLTAKKGFVFSKWGALEADDAKTAEGGYIELGTHEGEFVGVRLPYDWKATAYTLRIERGSPDGENDWFDFHVADAQSGESTYLGSLRFARKLPGVRATIELDGGMITFVEVYANAQTLGEVPRWALSSYTSISQGAPRAIVSSYPAYPYAEFPNIDIALDEQSSYPRIVFGGATARCQPPGVLLLSQ